MDARFLIQPKAHRATLTDKGWLVEEITDGSVAPGGLVMVGQPTAPGAVQQQPVSLAEAARVLAAAGMIAIPREAVDPELLKQLAPATTEALKTQTMQHPAEGHPANAATMIAKIKVVDNMDDLQLLMEGETRATVIKEAEKKAKELTPEGGAA